MEAVTCFACGAGSNTGPAATITATEAALEAIAYPRDHMAERNQSSPGRYDPP